LGLAQWQTGLPQRRVALVMEPGWKSPSSAICRSRVDLSSTKAGKGSGPQKNPQSILFCGALDTMND
jgi:hypothetical protein